MAESKQTTDETRYAVYAPQLGQYVSGVSDKATATQAAKDLAKAEGTVTHGMDDLEVQPV